MNIIFHCPFPLSPQSTSASGIRPIKMLEAFRELGFHVDVVSGYSKERQKAVKQVERKITSGFEYQLVYSESSTMPTVLTDPNHLPLRPFLDACFFRTCQKNRIPIALFYRDIYWRFESYNKNLSFFKRNISKACYYFDLWVYKTYINRLYLPSLEMGKYIPCVPKCVMGSLPPGHEVDLKKVNNQSKKSSGLNIFYVGGMSDHYQMHKLFSSIAKNNNDITLTVCTRQSEWLSVKSTYPNLTSNIQIIHKHGKEMVAHLLAADIVSIFVKPQEYWRFAEPFKLYEYLGYEKPIIVSQGTLAGSFVDKYKLGWSIPYEDEAICNLLEFLHKNPEEIDKIKQNMSKFSQCHSWRSRAEKVVSEVL